MSCTLYAESLPDIAAIVKKPEDRCPVRWALGVASAARMNNCGKSVFCRDGMQQLYTIIYDITTGKGQPDDIELLRDICAIMKGSEGCRIAQKAAGLIGESLARYPDEWDVHSRRRRCTALECPNYYTIHILPEKCTGAGECLRVCAYGAIAGGAGLVPVVDNDKCTRCGLCITACPNGAAVKAGAVKPKVPDAPIPVGSGQPPVDGGGMRRRKRKSSDESDTFS